MSFLTNLARILSFCLTFFSCQKELQQPPAPPKYEGFGASTRGGTGKKVVHVTNLNATGEGSLYNAIGNDRIIVFDVAGTIQGFRWDSDNEFPVSNLTIDGNSAPSPGITLDNANNGNCLSFQKDCHDIIVQNIRIRNAGNDGINIVGGYNMIFDHISISGSGDGNFDITSGANNVTVQYCILGNGRPGWSGAMLIAYEGTKNISIHHNLFNSRGESGVGERNPFIHCLDNVNTTNFMVDFRCNVIWNWGRNNGESFGYGTGVDYGGTANIINNFYQTDGTQASNTIDFNHDSTNARGYLSGNKSGNTGVDPNTLSNHPMWPVPREATVTTESTCAAATLVLLRSGCQPLDATDKAMLSQVSLANCR
jgi:pectate lyase